MRDHTSLRAWQEAHAVSVGIAEGYTFGDSSSFTRHLGIAYGSTVETGELLQLTIETGIVREDSMKSLLAHNHETKRIVLGMLKRRRHFKAQIHH